jgi:hypothetical protein
MNGIFFMMILVDMNILLRTLLRSIHIGEQVDPVLLVFFAANDAKFHAVYCVKISILRGFFTWGFLE